MLWSTSGGNALFLRELVVGALDADALQDAGGIWRLRGRLSPSTRLGEVVGLRLGSLDDDARAAMEVVSVAEPVGLDELTNLAAPDAIDVLERRGLVSVHVEGARQEVRTAHPLYGEVVRAGVPAQRRQAIYRSLADRIEARGASPSGRHAAGGAVAPRRRRWQPRGAPARRARGTFRLRHRARGAAGPRRAHAGSVRGERAPPRRDPRHARSPRGRRGDARGGVDVAGRRATAGADRTGTLVEPLPGARAIGRRRGRAHGGAGRHDRRGPARRAARAGGRAPPVRGEASRSARVRRPAARTRRRPRLRARCAPRRGRPRARRTHGRGHRDRRPRLRGPRRAGRPGADVGPRHLPRRSGAGPPRGRPVRGGRRERPARVRRRGRAAAARRPGLVRRDPRAHLPPRGTGRRRGAVVPGGGRRVRRPRPPRALAGATAVSRTRSRSSATWRVPTPRSPTSTRPRTRRSASWTRRSSGRAPGCSRSAASTRSPATRSGARRRSRTSTAAPRSRRLPCTTSSGSARTRRRWSGCGSWPRSSTARSCRRASSTPRRSPRTTGPGSAAPPTCSRRWARRSTPPRPRPARPARRRVAGWPGRATRKRRAPGGSPSGARARARRRCR